jgi:hypothetical protein
MIGWESCLGQRAIRQCDLDQGRKVGLPGGELIYRCKIARRKPQWFQGRRRNPSFTCNFWLPRPTASFDLRRRGAIVLCVLLPFNSKRRRRFFLSRVRHLPSQDRTTTSRNSFREILAPPYGPGDQNKDPPPKLSASRCFLETKCFRRKYEIASNTDWSFPYLL